MIQFNNISVCEYEVTILSNIDLVIEQGTSVVLVGPSGSGKSSLIKTVVGALPLSSGSLTVDGVTLSPESAHLIRSKIAFIGQEPLMGAELVRDALMLPFSFKAHHGRDPSQESLSELLVAVGLDASILDKKSSEISGGEKQRIAILRALILNKSIIVADEFTSALDPKSKQQVMKMLLDGGKTILSVSHDPEWIELCDRKVVVVGGEIAEGGR